ncbi:MAG: MFS transporter [Thermoleophilia bacterium]|nr:MFS transporter [Thermoleophilia bacterium]
MRRPHYAWTVVGVAFLALLMAAGFRSVTGVLLIPLHDEFGWTHGEIGVAVAINLVCYGLASPFASALVGRFGVRKVAGTALVTIAVSSVATVGIDELWQLYLLWGVVNGTATGAIGVPLAPIVANRWFAERRGLVTGMLTASNATGSLIFLPLLAWLTGFDWRWASVAVAIAATVIVLPPVLAFLRERPEDVGLAPFGAPDGWTAPTVEQGRWTDALTSLAVASRSRTFWLLAATFFVCGATTNGLVSTHLIPAARDHGIEQLAAASLLATIGAFDIVGTLASGWLTDRYDPRRLLLVYYSFRGLALIALPVVFGAPGVAMAGFAVVYGLDWVATVPPTSALATETFRQRAPVIFAWVFAAHQLGAAVAAWGAGAIRDATGAYDLAWVSAGALGVAAALAILLVRRVAAPPAGAPAPA